MLMFHVDVNYDTSWDSFLKTTCFNVSESSLSFERQ